MVSLGQNELIALGIILCMHPANERRHYIVTSSVIGRACTQNDRCSSQPIFHQAIITWTSIDLWHGPLAINIIDWKLNLKMHLKMLSAKCWPFCSDLRESRNSSLCFSPHLPVAVTVHSAALHRRCLLPVAPPSSRLPAVAAVSLLVAVPLTVRRHVRGYPVVCKGHHQPASADTAASGGGACT